MDGNIKGFNSELPEYDVLEFISTKRKKNKHIEQKEGMDENIQKFEQ